MPESSTFMPAVASQQPATLARFKAQLAHGEAMARACHAPDGLLQCATMTHNISQCAVPLIFRGVMVCIFMAFRPCAPAGRGSCCA